MARIKKQESPIIRLTRWEEKVSFQKKVGKGPPKDEKYNMVWMPKGTSGFISNYQQSNGINGQKQTLYGRQLIEQ